jgi:serine/threonine-protein kinase
MVRATDSLELAPGQRLLDRYVILDRVGRGGMASIYRAQDERLDRVVCVKLLRKLIESGSTSGGKIYEATYEHFLQEAMSLSRLQHPNTLKIFDFGYIDALSPRGGVQQSPFQISEYLDGGNLEGHVRRRGPLGADETLQILEPIAGALGEAHQAGVLHRDIKPSNILFARVGEHLIPKLADFGIAENQLTRAEGEARETVSAIALFSPRWAAPEQLMGTREGPGTDVYGLALVAAFMLVGEVPFSDADIRETFTSRVRSDDFVRGRLRAMGLDPTLEDALVAGLRAEPASRARNPDEFLGGLRRAVEEFSTRPRRPPIRPPRQSITLELEALESSGSGSGAAERKAEEASGPRPSTTTTAARSAVQEAPFAGRAVRYANVHESLDLTFVDHQGGEVRFRVSLLPGGQGINVKGLSCFVARPGARPTPAISANSDGILHFVSTAKLHLGEVAFSFGQPTAEGRVFVVDGADLLVPYPQGHQAVALQLNQSRDLVVMIRR